MSLVADILARHIEDLQYIDIDTVLQDLRGKGIIKYGDYTEIASKTKKEKSLFLQQKLPQWGDNAFPALIEVLRQRNYARLANELEQGIIHIFDWNILFSFRDCQMKMCNFQDLVFNIFQVSLPSRFKKSKSKQDFWYPYRISTIVSNADDEAMTNTCNHDRMDVIKCNWCNFFIVSMLHI